MKKIRAKHVVSFLVALFAVSLVVAPSMAATLLLVYFFAGMIGIIVVASKEAWRKYSKKNKRNAGEQGRQPAQTPAPSAAVKHQEPPKPSPQVPRLPSVYEGLERRYHYQDVNVYMPNPQAMDMPGLEVGAEVILWQEKTNQYDCNAVAVVFGGYIIAYLNKGKLQSIVNDWLNKGMPVRAMVYAKASTGLQLGLAFYDLPKFERLMQREPSPRAFKLMRTGSAAVQDALDLCTEGAELDLEEDNEGRIAVVHTDIVGYLPARAVDYVEDCGGAEWCSVFLANKEMDENLKTTASVYIFRGK